MWDDLFSLVKEGHAPNITATTCPSIISGVTSAAQVASHIGKLLSLVTQGSLASTGFVNAPIFSISIVTLSPARNSARFPGHSHAMRRAGKNHWPR